MNLLLIDDHHLVLQGLHSLLQKMDGVNEVFTASNSKEAFEIINTHDITVVLTDLQMPDGSGFDIITKVKTTNSSIRILVLSMDERANSIEKALALGADGFVLKNEKIDILQKAIVTVNNGGQFVSAAIMRALLNKTSANSPITSREKEIAIALANGKSNQEVGESLFISSQTIATHRKNIYRKLSITNTAALVKYVAEQGWI
ncbi:DNA-binding response regulator, NarL/FixJ family, contains REC and HTH domains [Spirosomataceae bacterium TFI 002]|nr:DNA-binding response regulator, NarL/FixJ family, contains REC and HTH domains [Spirosomataceae bacterium TFI 002]